MYFRFRALFMVFVTTFPLDESRRAIKVTSLKCLSLNEDYMIFKKCNLKPISRDVFELNVHAVTQDRPFYDIRANIDIRKRTIHGGVPVFNITFDACEFMKNPRRYPLANICYKIFGFDRFSNMNHTCPYNGDIYLKNYRPDETILAIIPFPYSDYNIGLTWFLEKVKVGQNEISIKYFEQSDYKKRV